MTWVVVRFLEEDNVEVVPTKWVTSGETYCYWPPSSIDKIDLLIKNCTEPQLETWSKYQIKMMCRKPFEKFVSATAQATKACNFSDIESSEAELPQKRVRKPKVLDNNIDSSSSEEEGSVIKLPNPPRPKITVSSEEIGTSKMTSDEKFQNEIIKQLVTITNMLKIQSSAMEEIKRRVDFLAERTESLTGETKIRDAILNDILDMLPIKNDDDLLKLENLLNNESTHSNMAQTLSRLGGANYKDCIRRIMSKCITNEIAVEYSYRGHKSKKDFSKTKLSEVIIKAVTKFEKNTTEKDIELTMAIWLSKAAERMKEKTLKN